MSSYRPIAISNNRGFTIVETMISLAILGTILLFATIIIINVSNLYYKGIDTASAQDNTRSIINQLGQDLKFNVGPLAVGSDTVSSVPIQSYCIGSIRYSFAVGYRVGAGNESNTSGTSFPLLPHAIWRDDKSNSNDVPTGQPAGCPVVDITKTDLATVDPKGIELITANSRLTSLCVGTQSGSSCSPITTAPYIITAGVAYGSIDLFSDSASSPSSISPATTCAGSHGDQFCATSNLTTTVVPR